MLCPKQCSLDHHLHSVPRVHIVMMDVIIVGAGAGCCGLLVMSLSRAQAQVGVWCRDVAEPSRSFTMPGELVNIIYNLLGILANQTVCCS